MDLAQHLHGAIATYGYFAIFLIVAMESAGIPMPGETVLVTAAILAGQGTLKIYWVIGAAAAGAIIGDNCGYWIGRKFGFPLLYRYGRYIHLDERRLKLGQYLFLRHGGKVGRAFEHYARPVALAALIAAVIGTIFAARFIRYHEQALEEEAERALPGPLVKPKQSATR
jgi:membrane protein YqaA with SNARE-associated domain